jgi:hypothetical protein
MSKPLETVRLGRIQHGVDDDERLHCKPKDSTPTIARSSRR